MPEHQRTVRAAETERAHACAAGAIVRRPGRKRVVDPERSTIEWNLPPWRFRRAGTPGFYLAWMRPALFTGVLATNLDAGTSRHTATDAGAQIDLRFSVLSALDMTVSLGAAVASRPDRPVGRELMASLKILR